MSREDRSATPAAPAGPAAPADTRPRVCPGAGPHHAVRAPAYLYILQSHDPSPQEAVTATHSPSLRVGVRGGGEGGGCTRCGIDVSVSLGALLLVLSVPPPCDAVSHDTNGGTFNQQ